MKKKIILIIAMLILVVLPLNVHAAIETKNAKEAFAEEGITADLSDYTESEDKINLYLFRGKGCSHCYEFLTFVADTLIPKYGKYFNLVTYEVWNNQDNSAFMSKVATKLGADASGVPFIVIGDKYLVGYASSSASEVEEDITNLYNSSDKKDIISDLSKEDSNEPKKDSHAGLIVGIVVGVVALLGVGVYFLNKSQDKTVFANNIKKTKDE